MFVFVVLLVKPICISVINRYALFHHTKCRRYNDVHDLSLSDDDSLWELIQENVDSSYYITSQHQQTFSNQSLYIDLPSQYSM